MRRTAILLAAVLGVAACVPSGRVDRTIFAERYCYRTLGVVDCHAVPLAGEESRRVGFYDAPVLVISAADQ